VSNVWITYPGAGDNHWKRWLIPDGPTRRHFLLVKGAILLWEGSISYQLVGEVMAHQGDDG
jgi:hypothetical protein